MKTDETMESMPIEEMIQVLKTTYPKAAKMVDGRLKGGFEDHDSKEGRAIDGAISVLEEKAMSKSPFTTFKTEIQNKINNLRNDTKADDKVTKLICKAKIQTFGQVLDFIKEQEAELGIVEPEPTDEELDELIESIPDNMEELDLE